MAFCPRCGHRRLGNFRYCTQCNFDFDDPSPATQSSPAASSPVAAPPASSQQNQLATWAGLSWLASAALLAFLAFQQFEAASLASSIGLGDASEITATAAWNGLQAIITAFFAVRCLRGPDRGFLTTSVAWAVVNVGFGVYQVVNGATYWVFYAFLIASGLAGVLSWAARDQAPAKAKE